MHRHDKAVRPTSLGLVFTDKSGNRVRELTHERGAVSRLGEPHFGIERERRERLVGLCRPVDERARLPNEPRGEREQPARGQPIGRPGRPGYGSGNGNRPGKPGRPGRPSPYTRDNLYARPGRQDRVKTDYRPKGKQPKPTTKLPNNVYTDKDGNVYRRNNTGKWDKRENGKWAKPAPTNPGTQPN